MSVLPAENVELKLFQGSTLDQTFTFTANGSPLWTDPTGWKAGLQVRKALGDSTALLSLAEGTIPDPPLSTTKCLEFADDGVLRAYAADEVMAALDAAGFTRKKDHGEVSYVGVWDLELEKPNGERSRYIMGPVAFSPEVTI